MSPDNDWLIPSFVAHDSNWRGAIYAMRAGMGPEQVLECTHDHHTMRRALACAERELVWARRVVALAAEGRPS
jgi:hypothetical protein